jgi:hypothetical protein
MEALHKENELLEEIYNLQQFDAQQIESLIKIGRITEKDKFVAAKQILLGIAILYVITVMAYLVRPDENLKLLDICTTTFPPLATLILGFYFRSNHNV